MNSIKRFISQKIVIMTKIWNNLIFQTQCKRFSSISCKPKKFWGLICESFWKDEGVINNKKGLDTLQKTEMWVNRCWTFCYQQHNFWVRSPQQWAHLHTASNWDRASHQDQSSCPHFANDWWKSRKNFVHSTKHSWKLIIGALDKFFFPGLVLNTNSLFLQISL